MSRGAEIAVRFGQRVRELRKAKGLSQEAFAAACGLDRTYISGIERGKRNVSLRNIEAIAKAFGLSISELTKGLCRSRFISSLTGLTDGPFPVVHNPARWGQVEEDRGDR